MRYFLVSLSFCFVASHSFAWEGWLCQPQKGGKSEPWIGVVKNEDGQVTFALSQDLVRENGRLPVGEYKGKIKLSQSGFSFFASLNVSNYFKDNHYAPKTPWLTLILPVRPTGMVSEGWIIWGEMDDSAEYEPLNSYGCRIVS